MTHEALVDVLWLDSIRPLLLRYYPQTTEAELNRAHAYAYGGCLIQDIGYYPFGNEFFSDLAHYVRSGDFVDTMMRNARTVDELAFAVGALSHYIGDSIGHSQATNPATALTFPKLESVYGPIVTYEDAPVAHVRTEFGFDVAQSVFQRYAPRAYRRAIGFRVARQLLYRAFHETYGLPTRGILGPARSALPSYRWSVTKLLPAFLGAQDVILGGRLPADAQDDALSRYLVTISRSEYATKWGATYTKPGIRAHLFAFLVIIIPKVGTLKILSTKSPTTATEDLFVRSFNDSVAAFRQHLDSHRIGPDSRLENLDLDTGNKVQLGASRLVDATYADLVIHLASRNAAIPPDLRSHLLAYYANPPYTVDLDSKKLAALKRALEKLRSHT